MGITNYYDKLFFVDRFVVTRLQTGNWDQQTSDEDIREIGNEQIVETIIDPAIPTSITLNTNDWGSVDLLAQIVGKYNDASPNTATITEADFKKQKTDILVRVRDNNSGKLHRSVWIPNGTLDSIALSYSVDGNATENYTFTGDTDRTFFGSYKDVGVDIGTYSASNTFTTNVDAGTFTGAYVSINGRIFPFNDGTNDLFTWLTTTVTVTAYGQGQGVPDLQAGDRIRLVYYRTTPNDSFNTLDTSGLGAIKGGYVEIKMYNQSGSAPSTYTVDLQSVDVNGNFTRNDVKELGNSQILDRYLSDYQFNIDVSMNENDLEAWAKMLGVTDAEWNNLQSGTAGVDKKLQDAIGQLQTIEIKVYDDYTKSNLLKTITVQDASLTSSPFNLDVGSTGQVSFSLRSSKFSAVGNGAVGRLANAYPTGYPYMGLDA